MAVSCHKLRKQAHLFFAAYRFVLLLLLLLFLSLYGFFYKSFKQLPSILFATYVAFLCCCLPFYFSQRFVDFVVEAEGGRGGEAEDIFMLRWARQTSWCVRCERRTPVSIYICTCIICVSFAAAVSICTTKCPQSGRGIVHKQMPCSSFNLWQVLKYLI